MKYIKKVSASYQGDTPIATSITSSSTNDEVAGAKAVYDIAQDNYSTTEQVIGTWVDGRPLYRKVIFGTNTTTGVNIYTVQLQGIESSEVKKMYGSGLIDGTSHIHLGYVAFSGSGSSYTATNFFIGNVRNYNNNNEIFYRTSYALTNVTFILEYTKSTDSAS